MGIRMTQHRGLNKWAQEFLRGKKVLAYTEKGTRIYPDGRKEEFERDVHESSVQKEEQGFYQGMFFEETGESYPLHKYTFPDGKVFFEAVQASPWSSGPVFFLALKDKDGKWLPESLWSKEDIEEC